MKLVKSLLLSTFVCLAPGMALAGTAGGFDDVAVVPEPTGAVLMGVALVAVALIWRRRG